MPPKFVHEFGIANIVWSYNIAYNKHTFPEGKHPSNWAEFFDTDKFPGRRALRDRVNPMLEIGLFWPTASHSTNSILSMLTGPLRSSNHS